MGSSTFSFTARALLAVTLMVGFYALGLGVAAGLLYLAYAAIVYGHMYDLRIAIFCVVGAGIVLWSLVPRPDHFPAPGPLLTPDQHPRLFHRLRRVAQAVGQAMPAEVYLVPDVNAWVAQRGGVMGIGSRQVMALGLPLLQTLTVSETEAVLAHEFGHFHGGDTTLGPWLYKTRSTIARTVNNLAQHRSVLAHPFRWYGTVFLRITQAISRRQESIADALAARMVGAQPLINGLTKIHGGALAYSAYLHQVVVPVLEAGFRPPLAEGFACFLAHSKIAEAVSNQLTKEAGVPAGPYDSHPPLGERVAALRQLPSRQVASEDPLAISLLDNEPAMEAQLYTSIVVETLAQRLQPVAWEEVGASVFLPTWEEQLRENSTALTGLTVESLGEVCAPVKPLADGECGGAHEYPRLLEFVRKLVMLRGQRITDAQRCNVALELLGMALAVALARAGWSLHALPGDVHLARGEQRLEPFVVTSQLASSQLSPDEWKARCTALAVGDLPLAP